MDANGLRFWMLSQSNDWLPPWRGGTAYVAGQGVVDPNCKIQIAQTAGRSDLSQPAWKTSPGEITEDPANSSGSSGSISWVNSGPGKWQAGTRFAIGQYILDPSGNLQRVSATSGDAATGPLEPRWPVALNQTIADGNVVWSCAGPSQAGLYYCAKNNTLQLRSIGSLPSEDFTAAAAMVETVPMALDQFGGYARWDQGSGLIYAGAVDGSPAGEVPIYAPPQPSVTDLVLGYDGILYLAVGGALILSDRRKRWPDFMLTLPDFNFWRLAALPEGGVLALDRTKPQLGKVAGQPLRSGPVDTPDPGILRGCDPNANPPRMVARTALPAEHFVALAPMDSSQRPAQFALLSWSSNSAANQQAWVRIFNETSFSGTLRRLGSVTFPYALAWLGDTKLAAFATNFNEALIYDFSSPETNLVPTGETYILGSDAAANAGPFAHGFALPPNYANAPGANPLTLPLLPVSLNNLAGAGATNPASPAIIDSGTAQTVWHRMYLEAVLPAQCGAIIWLAASDDPADLFDPPVSWYPHIFGAADRTSIPAPMLPGTPSAAWQSIPTEVALAPALLHEHPIKDVQGLFMVLVQRSNKAVRNLTGRYLGVRIQLNGNHRRSPAIAGLRIYGSRFSYVQNYLPEIYREAKFGDEANTDGPSTRHDFFERFVDLFESQFTRIEDRVAKAYLLTRAESSPEEALDWLGSWIGIQPNNYPRDRRRDRLAAAPFLYRWRGTAKGITKALDVATGGMASRGAIIVIEDFRLRHIFATIIGADLSIKNNPLLPGYSGASNSIVGDTLFLGDPRMQAELQALYATDLGLPGGAQAAASVYDQFANRITVFVHNQAENVNQQLVRKIVEAEKPAHVLASVRIASQPLMIGLASLLGVNTYLAPEPPRNNVMLDVSDVGRYDVVTHMPFLDPRMESSESYEEYTNAGRPNHQFRILRG